MKIIQSFWSGKKEIHKNAFGWRSPAYHAMGWTLSCLQLTKFYSEVELYTDRAGYDFLIGELNLPYTKVHIVLDRLNQFDAELWGLSKITAYSLQQQPFIHVDGDVFIYQPFPSNVLTADLVAQNLEKVTGFYTRAFTDIERVLTCKPDNFGFESTIGETYSCNAGILGGNDIGFFQRYTADVFSLIENNQTDGIPSDIYAYFNLLFEQVFFYRKAQQEKKKTEVIFPAVYEDNRYPEEDMGDFTKVPFAAPYLHLIGPLKRNITVCDLMCRRLLKDYPDYYSRIVALCDRRTGMYSVFPEGITDLMTHSDYNLACIVKERLDILKQWGKIKNEDSRNEFSGYTSFLHEAERFGSVVNGTLQEFRRIPWSLLTGQDARLLADISFLYESRQKQLTTYLQKEKSVKIVSTTYDWTLFANERRHMPDVARETGQDAVYIVCIPVCLFPYHKEVKLDEFECLILSLLEVPRTFEGLLKDLENCFSEEDIKDGYEDFCKLVLIKIKHLLINKCLSVTRPVL